VFGKTIKIGSIGGIPISVDASWFLLAALIVWTQYANLADALGGGTAIGIGVLTAALFLGSILGHELAHAGMARLRKLPVTGIRLFMFGGATGIQMEEKPGDEFLTTIVGPLTSVAIGLALLGVSTVGGLSAPLHDTLRWVGGLNVFLGIANLVPGFPLDGGRILHAAIWRFTGDERKATSIAARSGMVVWAVAIVAGVYLIGRDELQGGIWLVLIGSMMFQGAKATLDRDRIFQTLARGTVAEAMGPPPESIPQDITLSEALDRYLRGHEHETFPVENERGDIVGALTFDLAAEVGRENPLRPVRDAMQPATGILEVGLDDPLDRVVTRLTTARLPAIVIQDGHIVGQIAIPDVDRWLRGRRVR
jgi:Zn-dependent protease